MCVENKVECVIGVMRGEEVMVEGELGEVYGVERRRLNEEVKGNIEGLGEEFMFELRKEEFENWKWEFGRWNCIVMGGGKRG